jgi:hypothetical protein
MPISEGFDRKAMERKIQKNLEAGFKDVKAIKLALMEELMTNLRAMQVREARAMELSDQILYIEEKYG